MPTSARLYTRVLVPLDGSSAAEFAIRFGADMAEKHQAELLLLHLRRLEVLAPADTTTEDDAAAAQTAAYLEALRKDIRAEGVPTQTHTLTSRDLRADLLSFIDAERVSAVVLSTQGRTPMLRLLFGSQAEQTLARFPVPVLLVRPVYQHVVVPLDGSKWSESAIPRAVEIARLHDAELVLFHVHQQKGRDYAGDWALAGQQQIADQSYEQMTDQMVALRNRLRQEGLKAREVIIRGGNPAQAINEFVESEDGISLIVMSTHGRTGLSRWLMGSVAGSVIREARCPVTLVYPDR
jgi:nucleotide-binding universal stress UspA family protein